jgi:hypothetical protein
MKKTLITVLLTAASVLTLGFVAPSKWIPWEGHPPARTLFSRTINDQSIVFGTTPWAGYGIFEIVPPGKKLVITNAYYPGGNFPEQVLTTLDGFYEDRYYFGGAGMVDFGLHGIVFDSGDTVLCIYSPEWTFTGYYTDAY